MEEYAFEQTSAAYGMASKSRVDGVGQITRELQLQLEALERLHSAVDNLEAHTQPIRLPQSEASMAAQDAPHPVRSEIATHIADRTFAINEATRKIETISHELAI